MYTTTIFARGLAILSQNKPSEDSLWKRIRPKLRLPNNLNLSSFLARGTAERTL